MDQATPPTVPGTPTMMAPHRGGVILALGILSIVIGGCGVGIVLGVIGWVMANNDLREMNEGVKDASGQGNVQAGKICSIIGVCIGAISLIFGLLWVVFAVVVTAAGAAGAAAEGAAIITAL